MQVPTENIRLVDPIICTCVKPGDERWNRAATLLGRIGGQLVTCNRGADGRCDLADSFIKLRSLFSIESILVEGGANIIQSVLEHRLASQVVITIKTSFLGGYRSMTGQLSHLTDLRSVTTESIGEDIIVHGYLDGYRERELLLQQWENYATSSESVYKRLYPERPSLK